jgi:hypothetical protein
MKGVSNNNLPVKKSSHSNTVKKNTALENDVKRCKAIRDTLSFNPFFVGMHKVNCKDVAKNINSKK